MVTDIWMWSLHFFWVSGDLDQEMGAQQESVYWGHGTRKGYFLIDFYEIPLKKNQKQKSHDVLFPFVVTI